MVGLGEVIKEGSASSEILSSCVSIFPDIQGLKLLIN